MDHVEVTDLEEWRAWLDQHHDQSPGAWLVSFRKGRGPYVGPYEANNEALRYGWFHAHRLRVDDLRIRHLYRPRRRYLPWSPSDRIETVKQIEAGYIHGAGLRRAREAQEDGSWDIGDEIRTGSIPLDLMEALDCRPDTRARFDLIDPAAKNQLLRQLSLDTGQRRGRRAELIEQLMNTVDRIDPLAPWWVPKKQFADDWVALAISGRLIGMFENAHEVNGALALTGPPGLGKSRSAAEFLRRNPKVAASVYLTPGSELLEQNAKVAHQGGASLRGGAPPRRRRSERKRRRPRSSVRSSRKTVLQRRRLSRRTGGDGGADFRHRRRPATNRPHPAQSVGPERHDQT